MAARMLALHARALLQDAVSPDLWSTAAGHSSGQGGSGTSGTSGSGGGGTSGLLPAAPSPAPGPEAAVNVNATDGASAGAVSPYIATPDTVVIILGVAAIVLTLTAIGLRLYRSEHGCCCRSRVVAQPTDGPAAGRAQQRADKPQRQQAPPVIVVMPNEELLCAVKDGAPKPAPPKLADEEAAGEEPALEDGSRLDPGLQSERRRRRQQQRRDAGHVPAWWVFDPLSWAAPHLLLPAAPRPGMQREQAAAAKCEGGSFCYII